MTAAVLALVLVAAVALAAAARRRRHALVASAVVAAVAAASLVGAVDVGALAVWVATLAVAAAAVAATVVATRRTLEADRRRPLPASGGLIGRVGVVRRPLDPVGQIAVNGELWRARRSWGEEEDLPLREGDVVIVEHIHGLTLTVRRAEDWEVQP